MTKPVPHRATASEVRKIRRMSAMLADLRGVWNTHLKRYPLILPKGGGTHVTNLPKGKSLYQMPGDLTGLHTSIGTLRNAIRSIRTQRKPSKPESWLETQIAQPCDLTQPMSRMFGSKFSGDADLEQVPLREKTALRVRAVHQDTARPKLDVFRVEVKLTGSWRRFVRPLYDLDMPTFGTDRFVLHARPITTVDEIDFYNVRMAVPVWPVKGRVPHGWMRVDHEEGFLAVNAFAKTFAFGETLLEARSRIFQRVRNIVQTELTAKPEAEGKPIKPKKKKR